MHTWMFLFSVFEKWKLLCPSQKFYIRLRGWDLHYLLTCQEILMKPIRRQGLEIGVLVFYLKHQK